MDGVIGRKVQLKPKYTCVMNTPQIWKACWYTNLPLTHHQSDIAWTLQHDVHQPSPPSKRHGYEWRLSRSVLISLPTEEVTSQEQSETAHSEKFTSSSRTLLCMLDLRQGWSTSTFTFRNIEKGYGLKLSVDGSIKTHPKPSIHDKILKRFEGRSHSIPLTWWINSNWLGQSPQ